MLSAMLNIVGTRRCLLEDSVYPNYREIAIPIRW